MRHPELWEMFMQEEIFIYDCIYCGQPSMHHSRDQTPPVNYCHPSDHGDLTMYYSEEELDQMYADWLAKHPEDFNHAKALQSRPPS